MGSWAWDNRTAVMPPHNASTALGVGEGADSERGALFYPEAYPAEYPADLERRWVWSALVATVDQSDRHADSEARRPSQVRKPFYPPPP